MLVQIHHGIRGWKESHRGISSCFGCPASPHDYGTCWTAPTQVLVLTGLPYCFFYPLSDKVLTVSHCCWSLWSLAALVCFLNPSTALQVILPLKSLEPPMEILFPAWTLRDSQGFVSPPYRTYHLLTYCRITSLWTHGPLPNTWWLKRPMKAGTVQSLLHSELHSSHLELSRAHDS